MSSFARQQRAGAIVPDEAAECSEYRHDRRFDRVFRIATGRRAD
jgi:hypothetical protein